MNVFDSHFHIINPNYPLVPNNGYLPPVFTVQNYREKVQEFGVTGGVIVSGSFQQFEQQYLIDALHILGKSYFGVANIPMEMQERELEKLHAANIRAVRFNLRRGGSEHLSNMVALANKLFDRFGWHSELYVDSKTLVNLRKILHQIPAFSIDHLGLSRDGLSELYYWVEKGAKIKATGF
ncbi:amidohydrolase [Tenacibaculum sp. SG-28]|uniref:amidohydrolase family protein n=1 Tax=Tenacibaculum sp. SG-28 TaxID=754426 RepID=UPI0018ECBC25|nr:amidohydrolase family protein [Tenacibaculum sp. SG-28]